MTCPTALMICLAGIFLYAGQRAAESFEALESRGLMYAERGDLKQALPLLEKACRVNGSSAEAFANLGVAYIRLSRITQAVTALGRAVSLDPKNGETQGSYGQALLLAKRSREAAKAFEAENAIHPGNAETLYNWGLAVFDSGDARGASAILDQIPLQSRSAQVESLLGDVEERQGRFDLALASFQRAAKADPSEENVNALGIELLKHWSFDAAIQIYEYGVSRYVSSSRLQFGLGIAKYGNNQYEQAALVFSRLLAAHPDEATYGKVLGWSCLAIKGDAHEGCEGLVTYAQRHPENVAAATAAAGIILKQHDSARFDVARELLERAISEDETSADAYYRLGFLDQEQGEWEESVDVLRRAAVLRPNSSRIHLRLASAYWHLDKKEQAHEEAVLQKKCRDDEDADMEARRREIKTFVRAMR